MPKTPRRGRYLKKRPNPSGGNQEQAPGWNDHGNLVAGRGQGRAKNIDYPALGKTGDASLGPQGSANSLGIYLLCYLPGPRCRRCPDPSKMQYCHLDTSSTGNIRCCCSWSTCHRHRRSSRMALLKSSGDTGQYYLAFIASKMAGAQSVETIWQFMRDNWLSNRIFKSYNDIVDHCCFAWNQLIDQPWRIMSIGLRDWAHQ